MCAYYHLHTPHSCCSIDRVRTFTFALPVGRSVVVVVAPQQSAVVLAPGLLQTRHETPADPGSRLGVTYEYVAGSRSLFAVILQRFDVKLRDFSWKVQYSSVFIVILSVCLSKLVLTWAMTSVLVRGETFSAPWNVVPKVEQSKKEEGKKRRHETGSNKSNNLTVQLAPGWLSRHGMIIKATHCTVRLYW